MKNILSRLSFLSLGHLTIDLYPGLLSPLLPVLIARNGWTLAYAGLLVSVMQISCNLSQPFIAIFNDHRPSRSLLWTSLIISGLPFCFILMSSSLTITILLLISSGIGVAMFHPVAAAAAGRSAAGNRSGILMAVFSAGGLIGFSIAPMITVFIVEFLGPKYMPVIILPAALMALYFALNRTLPIPESHGYTLKEWAAAMRENSRDLFLLWLISGLRAVTYMLLGSFLPMLIMARGAMYTESATWLTISLLCSMLGLFVGGHLSDKFGKRRTIALSLFLASPFLYIFLFTSGTVSLVFLCLGMASLSSTIPVNIIMAQQAAPKLAGTASSLVMGLSVVLGAVTATPFGAFADHIGIGSAMVFPFALPVVAGLFVFLLRTD